MCGRPRVFAHARHFTVTVEQTTYEMLKGEMLEDHRRKHPRACLNDLVCHVLHQAAESYRQGEAERERAQRRLQVRRLAVACAGAPDDKVELHARKLAALVEGERPTA